jgi:hypothetical protein
MVAPDATTRVVLGDDVAGDVGAAAQLHPAVEDDHVAVDLPGDGDRGVKGGQRPVDGAVHGRRAVEHDQVADLLTLGHVGPAGQDHERLGGLSGLRPCGRRHTENQDDEESENLRPTHADHLQCIKPVSSGSVVNSTRIGTIGAIERSCTLLLEDPRRRCGVRTGSPTT